MSLMIVCLNWNDEARTLQCIRSLRGWTTLNPRILVVDNESTDASHARLSAELDPEELTCSTINLGYSGGNNLGIKRALSEKSDFVLLLNSDAEVAESAIAALVNRLESHPEISILGPVIVEQNADTSKCIVGGRDMAIYPVTRLIAEPDSFSSVIGFPLNEVDYVPGTVFLARGELFSSVGLLDEEYFFSGEIADFCKRARDLGHKACVDLEVSATHVIDQEERDLRNSLYLYYSLRNRFLYISKHYPEERISKTLTWLKTGLRRFLGALINRDTSGARAVFLAIQDGLLNRFGNQNGRFFGP